MSDKAPAPDAGAEHPGAQLGEARKALGVARADVAASLHLEEEVVAALEAGRDEDLPALAYVRGYVRGYARLVGLDAEQLVQQLDSAATAPYRATRPVLRHSAALPSFAERAQRHVGLLLGGIVLAVLLLAGGALWLVQGTVDWPFADASPVPTPEETPNVEVPAPVAAPAPPAPAPDPDRLAAERAAILMPAPEDEAPPMQSAPDPATQASLATGTVVADLPAATESAAGMLSFRFDDDSWLEVRDAAGEVVHADLGRAGETLALTGEPPFSILLGNAAGVELRYDGNPVALLPHTQQNVARLVVGH